MMCVSAALRSSARLFVSLSIASKSDLHKIFMPKNHLQYSRENSTCTTNGWALHVYKQNQQIWMNETSQCTHTLPRSFARPTNWSSRSACFVITIFSKPISIHRKATTIKWSHTYTHPTYYYRHKRAHAQYSTRSYAYTQQSDTLQIITMRINDKERTNRRLSLTHSSVWLSTNVYMLLRA